MKAFHRSAKWFLLLTCILLFSACSGRNTINQAGVQETTAESNVQSATDYQVVKHAMGKTEVPVNPQRIITLDNIALDSLLALGVKPVAGLYNENSGEFPPHLQGKVEGVKKLAATQQNLETIAALQPDLILGSKNAEPVYKLLSKIAPTVILETSGTTDWKKMLMLTAEAISKTEAGKQALNNYNDRIKKLRAKLGDRSQQIEVSVIRIFPDRIRLYQQDSFIGEILTDAGLARPPAQRKDVLWQEISEERIKDVDGDVIFVWAIGKEAETAFKKLKSDPLWSKLKAVQRDRVYAVPDYWIGSGPLAANAVIDDLFTYLVKENN